MKQKKNEEISQLDQLILIITKCFSELGLQMTGPSVEKVAVMIYEAMSTRTRLYHRVEHCLSTPPNVDALGVLAYLFHDVIYWQVDRVKNPRLRQYIAPFELSEQGSIEISGSVSPQTVKFSENSVIARLVFGVSEPAELSFAYGMNEFLSACVAENVFKGVLDYWQIVELACCIEATIPFRRAHDGKTAIEKLSARLRELNRAGNFKKSDEDITKAIRRAIDVANHDVGNFAYATTSVFLKNTWDLTWENNPSLQCDTYTVKQYRSALQNNVTFYRGLEPKYVFSCFEGYPSQDRFDDIVERTRRNITIGLEYIRVKLVASAIVESVAELTGGDAPLMMFMGNHPQLGLAKTWAGLLNNLGRLKDASDIRQEVFKLLFEGREEMKEQFDVARSPVSAHVYFHLDASAFDKASALADEFFSQRMTAKEFLLASPINAVFEPVLEKFKEIVISRRELLINLEKELRSKKKAAA